MRHSLGPHRTLERSRCAGRAPPRATQTQGRSGECATGARLGALVPPLSHWILLRPHVDASRHLRCRLRRTHAPWERVEVSVRFFSRSGLWGPTRAHRTEAREAARDRAEAAGDRAHARAHLPARRVRCVQLAPGACSPCSEDGVDGVHDVIALHAVRLDGASCRLHAGWRHDTRHTHT